MQAEPPINPAPRLYLAAKGVETTVGADKLISVIASTPPVTAGRSHCPVGGCAIAEDVLHQIMGAVKHIQEDIKGGCSVAVYCARGPARGGASGAVGAAYLMATRVATSLKDALAQTCGTRAPRGLLLSALCALELQIFGGSSDLPVDCSTYWDLRQDATAGSDGAAAASAPESIAVARGATMAIRAISKCPQIAHVSGFVSAEEARHLISLAEARLEPSRVARTAPAGESVWRTSSSCAIGGGAAREGGGDGDAIDSVVERVVERAAYLSGLSARHAEDLQVVHYSVGQQYREHSDFFSPTQDATYTQRCSVGGNRLVTIFCCLHPAASGGATAFSHLGLSFTLKLGEALLWMNIDRHGALDGRTLHAGMPPTSGEKYGLNVWLRQRPLDDPPGGGCEGASSAGSPSAAELSRAPAGSWKPVCAPPPQTRATTSAQTVVNPRERLC